MVVMFSVGRVTCTCGSGWLVVVLMMVPVSDKFCGDSLVAGAGMRYCCSLA